MSGMTAAPPPAPAMAALGLGLDAGGTQTRWALAGADGGLRGEGHVASISGLQLDDDAGRWAGRRVSSPASPGSKPRRRRCCAGWGPRRWAWPPPPCRP